MTHSKMIAFIILTYFAPYSAWSQKIQNYFVITHINNATNCLGVITENFDQQHLIIDEVEKAIAGNEWSCTSNDRTNTTLHTFDGNYVFSANCAIKGMNYLSTVKMQIKGNKNNLSITSNNDIIISGSYNRCTPFSVKGKLKSIDQGDYGCSISINFINGILGQLYAAMDVCQNDPQEDRSYIFNIGNITTLDCEGVIENCEKERSIVGVVSIIN